MTAAKAPANLIAVYANGLFQDGYPKPTVPYETQAQQLAQGMTTIILWSIHIHSGGDLFLNNSPFVSNGKIQYSADPKKGVNPDFPHLMRTLTGSGSKVTQVLISVGAWSTTGDFDNWYSAQAAVAQNIQALVKAFGVVGVDFDFEPDGPNAYGQQQQDMIVALTEQVAEQGLFVTYCPYTAQGFWNGCLKAVYARLKTQPVRWWNLQCYAGGEGNDPTLWAQRLPPADLSGVTHPSAYIVPGFAAGKGGQSPSSIQQTFGKYAKTRLTGGFLWNSGAIFNGESGGAPTPLDYANAISSGLTPHSIPFFSGLISGVASVGPNGGSSPMSVTVPFQMPFKSPPVVIANALQGTNFGPGIPDTFAVTITSVSNTQFTANVYRVDASGGWGQNLQLGWLAYLG